MQRGRLSRRGLQARGGGPFFFGGGAGGASGQVNSDARERVANGPSAATLAMMFVGFPFSCSGEAFLT